MISNLKPFLYCHTTNDVPNYPHYALLVDRTVPQGYTGQRCPADIPAHTCITHMVYTNEEQWKQDAAALKLNGVEFRAFNVLPVNLTISVEMVNSVPLPPNLMIGAE